MPAIIQTYAELGPKLDMRTEARLEYESRVASKSRVLDIGGRNQESKSAKRLRKLSTNPNSLIVSTDILAEYEPDIVDDICNTGIAPGSFDGVYCDAILEHVTEYWTAIDNIHTILVDGGEAFIYVPFFFHLRDEMDYHRFTVTEVARMLNAFSEVKIFVPEKHSGYGYVLWSLVTYARINKLPRAHLLLAGFTNAVLHCMVQLVYRMKSRPSSFNDAAFYYKYLYVNHGFCAWVKK